MIFEAKTKLHAIGIFETFKWSKFCCKKKRRHVYSEKLYSLGKVDNSIFSNTGDVTTWRIAVYPG